MSFTMYKIFKSNCRNYVMPTYMYATHEESSVDAQNPYYACPL